jgi:L-ascorbate metabolism protein UlaG (beta-lactamase superfamily)
VIEPLQSDHLLLDDIARATRDQSAALHLWWLGQSGFLVQNHRKRILFDPYLSDTLTTKYAATDTPHVRMSKRVIDPELLRDIDLVTSTHGHTDHLDSPTLNAIFRNNASAAFAYARATQPLVDQRIAAKPAEMVALSSGERHGDIAAVPAFHKPAGKDANGNNHCIGLVVRIGAFTIYHSGDTLYDPSLATAVTAHGPIDIAILPINGKVGNMNGTDAARLAHEIGAKLVVPCHFHLFEFNTAEPEELFIPECEKIQQSYRVLRLGERLTL